MTAQESLFPAPPMARVPVGEAPRLAAPMSARVRADNVDTSWEAAAGISEAAASELEQLILSALRVYGPMKPALIRHGGYGATRETVFVLCDDSECRGVRQRVVAETNPRRAS